MTEENSSKTWKIGCLSATAVIVAAIIGLGVPFAERIADVYFPPPTTVAANSTVQPQVILITAMPQFVESPASTNAQIFPPATSASTSPLNIDGPFREHQTASVGTGVFTQVTFSDGNAPYSQSELDTNHFRIYRIRPEENPNGCGVSIYNTNKVWFSSSANTVFTVNGIEVGRLSVSTGRHGYVADWSIKTGDTVCAAGYSPSGFHIIFGPDMYYHYDSYCFRGNC